MPSLLTLTNPKTSKSLDHGYLTLAHHLAPASLSGRNVCSHSSIGCREACLNFAGHGRMANVQAARVRKTREFTADPRGYVATLKHEIIGHQRRAEAKGLQVAVRLNTTSDIPWENVKCGRFANLMEATPGVTYYDYTKIPIRLRQRALAVPNYHLTFSMSEDNEHEALMALRAGVNVAVVFPVGEVPDFFWGREVIRGDDHDLRFLDHESRSLDHESCIVGLSVLSPGSRDDTGFVRRPRPRYRVGMDGRPRGRRRRGVNR